MSRDFPITPDRCVDAVSSAMAVVEPVATVGVHCCDQVDATFLLDAGPQRALAEGQLRRARARRLRRPLPRAGRMDRLGRGRHRWAGRRDRQPLLAPTLVVVARAGSPRLCAAPAARPEPADARVRARRPRRVGRRTDLPLAARHRSRRSAATRRPPSCCSAGDADGSSDRADRAAAAAGRPSQPALPRARHPRDPRRRVRPARPRAARARGRASRPRRRRVAEPGGGRRGQRHVRPGRARRADDEPRQRHERRRAAGVGRSRRAWARRRRAGVRGRAQVRRAGDEPALRAGSSWCRRPRVATAGSART